MTPSANGSKKVQYTAAQGRKFGLTVGLAFALLATISWWRGHPITVYVLGVPGALLLLAALVIPRQLSGVERAWMAIGAAISKVTTPVFMGVVYFGVLLPVGLLMRAFGRNAVKHKPVENSYWAARSDARGSMLNQF